MKLSAGYHDTVKGRSQFQSIVRRVAKTVQRLHKKHELTHLVATGISGQAVAWPVSYITGIPVAVVRKPGEKYHSDESNKVVGSGELKKFVIIDDFVVSGDTVRRILRELGIKKVEDKFSVEPELVACLVYDSRAYDRPVKYGKREFTSKRVR